MKKIYILCIALLCNFSMLQAQDNDCGLPTCETPGDPGQTIKNPEFSVYPNPSTSGITVNLSSFTEQKVTVSIVDLQGRKIESQEVLKEDHTPVFTFDLSTKRKGNYLVVVYGKGYQKTKQFIKL